MPLIGGRAVPGYVRRTKILATVGPASAEPAALARLVEAGANALRVNFSHGTDAEHREVLARIHRLVDRRADAVAIVADIQGPKIRLGEVSPSPRRLAEGRRLILDSRIPVGTEDRVPVTIPEFSTAARAGDPVLIGDGSIELVVDRADDREIVTRVVHGGLLTSHAGLYLPRAHLRSGILGTKDRADIAQALAGGVDFVALSFVRDARDVREARALLRRHPRGDEVGLIAKIERSEALARAESILAASDGIMVARGDLGIEVPLERLALEQKRLVGQANSSGRFVIVATQMLLSMVSAPRPTRAEATDVANAVIDGADAVMLSEESAIGAYPAESVQWLDRICRATESAMFRGEIRSPAPPAAGPSLERAVAEAAVHLARELRAGAIVTPTHSGRTAGLVAAFRPSAPIVALSSQPATRRRLALVWGVASRPVPSHLPLAELRRLARGLARSAVGGGGSDRLVLTAGYPVEGRPTNLVTVMDGDGEGRRRPETVAGKVPMRKSRSRRVVRARGRTVRGHDQ